MMRRKARTSGPFQGPKKLLSYRSALKSITAGKLSQSYGLIECIATAMVFTNLQL
jgi:hypothetical protein